MTVERRKNGRNLPTQLREPEISADLSPQRGFPAINLELLGVEGCFRKCPGRLNDFVLCRVFGWQFHITIDRRSQAVDRQTELGQNLVADDVIMEYGFRIEGLFIQNDAVGMFLFLANRLALRRREVASL
jgi:hypothetical protein